MIPNDFDNKMITIRLKRRTEPEKDLYFARKIAQLEVEKRRCDAELKSIKESPFRGLKVLGDHIKEFNGTIYDDREYKVHTIVSSLAYTDDFKNKIVAEEGR